MNLFSDAAAGLDFRDRSNPLLKRDDILIVLTFQRIFDREAGDAECCHPRRSSSPASRSLGSLVRRNLQQCSRIESGAPVSSGASLTASRLKVAVPSTLPPLAITDDVVQGHSAVVILIRSEGVGTRSSRFERIVPDSELRARMFRLLGSTSLKLSSNSLALIAY